MRSAAQEYGFDFADAAPGYAAQKLGKELTLEELGDFYYAATSTMAGILYSALYNAKGQEEADGWLAKVLVGIPTMVRAKGIPVVISLQSSVKPLAASPEEHGMPLIKIPSGPCTCSPRPQGVCAPCLERITRNMKTIIGSIASYLKQIRDLPSHLEKGCRECDFKNLDSAFAVVIKEALSKDAGIGATDREQLTMLLYQMATQIGVKELPLTEKAWAAL